MNILSIESGLPSEEKIREFSKHGARLSVFKPGALKFMAPWQLSKIIDREKIDIVETHSIDEAILAIHAKEIARHKNFKVAVKLAPNTPAPRSLPSDICRKVDLWIFPSAHLHEIFASKGSLIDYTVVEPTNFADTKIERTSPATKNLTRVGKITDSKRLRRIVDSFNELCKQTTEYNLRICGEGKPEEVMPVVKHARCLECNDKITWTGDDYNVLDEVANCHICISSADDITEEETLFSVNDIDIIEPEEIEKIRVGYNVKNSVAECYTKYFHVKQLIEAYKR